MLYIKVPIKKKNPTNLCQICTKIRWRDHGLKGKEREPSKQQVCSERKSAKSDLDTKGRGIRELKGHTQINYRYVALTQRPHTDRHYWDRGSTVSVETRARPHSWPPNRAVAGEGGGHLPWPTASLLEGHCGTRSHLTGTAMPYLFVCWKRNHFLWMLELSENGCSCRNR